MRICVEQRRGKVAAGFIIAVIGLLGGIFLGSPMKIILPLMVMSIASGFLWIDVEDKRILWGGYALLFLMLPVVTFWTGWLMQEISKYHMTLDKILLNAAIYLAFQFLFLMLTSNLRFSMLAGQFVILVMILVNIYVVMFRGNQFTPYDLLAVQTAANVAADYDFTLTPKVWCGFMIMAIEIRCLFCVPKLKLKRRGLVAAVSAAAMVLSMACVMVSTREMRAKYWTNQGATRIGIVLNFFLQVRDSFVREPEGYDLDRLDALAGQYPETENQTAQPDIIVIMNESFADFNVFNNELRTNVELTPFLDSLQENTIRGYTYSSIFGGRTANSEWEYLTGNTMAFLPQGTVPYQQYMSETPYSLVSALKDQGYDCIAMHPYHANGWRRAMLYPDLGFEAFYALDDFPQTQMVREYVSDQEMMEQMVAMYEQQDEDTPLFLFGITMQNHGGYSYEGDNFEKTVELEGYSQEYPKAEQYLSLLRETDSAMEWLIDYYSQVERDVVIVFFGDHMPSVESKFYEEINGNAFETLDQKMKKQQIPFFIWTNYDIEEQTVALTSMNYLSVYTLEAAGLELPPYFRFLKNVSQEIPVITSEGCYFNSLEGFAETWDEAAAESEKEWLRQYQMLQYNNIFDDKEKSQHFFARD